MSPTAIYARLNLDSVRQALERNASKMLEAAVPHRTPANVRNARIRSRSMLNRTSHTVEPAIVVSKVVESF